LGLLVILGCSIEAVLVCLEEKVWKVHGYKGKLLSNLGKEVLIKTMAIAIPTYMMSIFRIPGGLLEEIYFLHAQWGSTEKQHRMHS